MKKESHAYACEMGGVFFSKVASRLTLEELLYWLREHEELLSLLKRPNPVLIGHASEPFSIDATLVKDTVQVFNSGSPFKKPIPSDWANKFLKTNYAERPRTDEAVWYPLLCHLLPSEVITVLGGEDMISNSHFSPQQVRLLARRQNTADKTDGPLSFEMCNYFPIAGKGNNVVFLAVSWAPIHPSYKKNQWSFYFPHAQFMGGEKFLTKGGRLFMC